MYFISEDSFYKSIYAISISKKFRRKIFLNDKIHRLFAAGLFQKMEKDEQFILKLNHLMSSNSTEPRTCKIWDLQDLKGAFIVLFSNIAVSTVVLIIEIAVKRY